MRKLAHLHGVPLPGPMPLVGGALKLVSSQVIGNTAVAGGGILNNLGSSSAWALGLMPRQRPWLISGGAFVSSAREMRL